MADTQLIVELLLKNGQYIQELAKAQGKTSQAAKAMKGYSSAATFDLKKIAGLVSVGAVMYKIAEETKEAQAAQAKLNAVIASTGGAAGVSAQAANDLASKLSDLTAIDDDVIVGAEAVLLRFRNMSEKIFPDATQAALDFSAATGKDLNASALAVGKALDSLGQNTTALNKAGITLTESQKAQAAALAATGDKAGAQKIVLEALNRAVGGSAASQANTLSGALSRISNTAGDMAKIIGNNVTPGLNSLARAFSKSAEKGGLLYSALDWISQRANRALVAMSGIALIIEEIGNNGAKDDAQKLRDRATANAEYWLKQIKTMGGMAEAKKKAAAGDIEAQNAVDKFNDAIAAGNKQGRIALDIQENRIKKIEELISALNSQKAAEFKLGAGQGDEGDSGTGDGKKKKSKYPDTSGLFMGGAAALDFMIKQGEEDASILSKAAQTVVQDIATLAQTWADNISGIFNQLTENQIQSLDHYQSQISRALDFAEQAELKAANVRELTRSQTAAKEVRDLQKEIAKTTSIKKRKALQEQLIEERKEQKRYEIQDRYERQRQTLETVMDFARMQLQRRQFERNKQYQIASVWINTSAAIAAAWLAAWQMQSSGGVWAAAVALGAVSTALMLANAAAQTAQISLQKAPMFEQGTWYVPQTGPAILHEGEKVVTKTLAESIDSGEAVLGSGKQAGNVHLHFHGPVFDTKAHVQKALKSYLQPMGLKFSTGGVW